MSKRHSQALAKPSAWTQQANYYRNYLSEEKVGKIRVIVELGVDYGYSLFTLAKDYPDALVFGVDKFCFGGEAGAKDRRDHLAEFILDYPNIMLMEMDTTKLGKGWKNHEFYVDVDVLHIDADHTYDSVKADYEAWVPHVRPGGAVMFHDVTTFPSDVGKFFNELDGEKYIEGNWGIWYHP